MKPVDDKDKKEEDVHHIHTMKRLMAKCEPSNRADMQFLLKAFPLYQIHNPEIWEMLDEVENEID